MIQFPQTMPTVGASAQSFEPERVDFLSPEAGGRLGAITAGFPRWTMRITLNAMTFDQADIWRAWLAIQRGPQRPFFAFDMDRREPRHHRDGRPYAPSATVWHQQVREDGLAELTLEGVFRGQVVGVGDYVGFVWDGGKHELVRAVGTAIANASGIITVPVEPPVPSIVPPEATAVLRNPGCLMRLVPGETKLGEQGQSFFTAGSTIVAVQDTIR